MTLRKTLQLFILLFACALMVAGMAPGAAFATDGQTPVSCQFMGVIRDDGIVVPAGYNVIAKINGVQKATTTTNAEGKYGYDAPFVITDIEGKTIEFWVNGKLADQSGIVQEGGFTFLNLSFMSGNPPVKTSTGPTGSKPAPGTYTPTFLRGQIMNDGVLVPAGYTLVVKINGIDYASTKTTAEGKYGFDSVFSVEAQDGDVMVFYINGNRADQTYAAEGGSMATVDLDYKDTSASLPPAPPAVPNQGSGSTPTTPAGSGSPIPTPKEPSSPAPSASGNSGGDNTSQVIVIVFIVLMVVLCLGLVYAINKRRQAARYSSSSSTQIDTRDRGPRY
jgi:hypothetical protein